MLHETFENSKLDYYDRIGKVWDESENICKKLKKYLIEIYILQESQKYLNNRLFAILINYDITMKRSLVLIVYLRLLLIYYSYYIQVSFY